MRADDEPLTVFIVDDNVDLREGLCLMLAGAGMTVEAYPDGATFLAAIHAARRGCLLLDQVMPGMSGLQVQETLRSRGLNIPVIILSGSATPAVADQALRSGALLFLEKPVDGERLLECIRQVLARYP